MSGPMPRYVVMNRVFYYSVYPTIEGLTDMPVPPPLD